MSGSVIPLGTRLILPFVSRHLCRLWRDIFGRRNAFVAVVVGPGLFALNTTLVSQCALKLVFTVAANALEAGTLVLPVVLAIVLDFGLGLARAGVAQTPVDILGGGSPQGRLGSGFDSLLSVAALDQGVQGLAAGLPGGVRGV